MCFCPFSYSGPKCENGAITYVCAIHTYVHVCIHVCVHVMVEPLFWWVQGKCTEGVVVD